MLYRGVAEKVCQHGGIPRNNLLWARAGRANAPKWNAA